MSCTTGRSTTCATCESRKIPMTVLHGALVEKRHRHCPIGSRCGQENRAAVSSTTITGAPERTARPRLGPREEVLPLVHLAPILTGDLIRQVGDRVREGHARIYEYFLGGFARTEGQKRGEFYMPSSIVKLLAEVIEPYLGRILDPASGSGGMVVQSARFVAEHKKNPSAEPSICGVEKTDEIGRLCRLNLAVHGLEGDTHHGGLLVDEIVQRSPIATN